MTQYNKIASFDGACEAVAKKYGYDSWNHLWIKRDHSYLKEAAELYAEYKARDAWDRACEAQKWLCADNAIVVDIAKVPFVSKKSILNAPKPDYLP